MKYFLGVDGGGTKTQSVLIDEDGKIVGRADSGGTNAFALGFASALINLKHGIVDATRKIKPDFVCLAISGVNSVQDARVWKNRIAHDEELLGILGNKYIVVNDTQAALRAGTEDKNAIVLVAGTGSNCWGRNENGKEAKSGGLDYLLSDEGAGFYLGQQLLYAVVKAQDGRGSKTKLVKLLFEKLDISNLGELAQLVYSKPWNKTDIASLSPLIEAAITADDAVAEEIAQKAVEELFLHVRAVCENLGFKKSEYSMVTTGSVFKIQKKIYEELVRKVLKFTPRVKFVVSRFDSATGAAFLARDLMLEN